MLHVLLAFWLLLRVVSSSQIPLQVQEDKWNLAQLPSINATGHLIFATAGSFMQHWPNTRYRNGHNLVVGTIPPNTLLYHGRSDDKLPDVPEWIATDPEHSYIFCRGSSQKGCWHLTLVSNRPLKVLYFDGSSAAKMLGGPMDSQDIVSWGKVMSDRFFDEKQRITDLCSWAKKVGIDGFIRMEMDFELMYCNFTAGVEIVSFSNLVPRDPGNPPSDPIPATVAPGGRSFEVVYSGSWHNHFPGDTRIRLDYTRFISFYDTSLVPSLVDARFGQHRLQHRLEGISERDTKAVLTRLELMLSEDHSPSSSGVDWETLLRVVQDRFSERLEILQYVLNATDSDTRTDLIDRARKAQHQLHVILQPYMLHSAVPEPAPSKSWASPVFKLCATTHTKWIHSSVSSFTSSESTLLRAIEETNREVCRVVVNLWAEGVQAGLDDTVKLPESSTVSPSGLVDGWRNELERLMGWLDWSVWLKCRPACGFEEICYLPTWPYFKRAPGDRHFPSDPNDPEFKDPRPKCIRRIEPYDLVA